MSHQGSIASVRREAEGCRACPLWRDATQTVFGEGRPRAALMLVGEQPGDREDRAGHPFVGPAGAVLDDALEQAGIERSAVYVTNAVKHFKHRARGKRRIHQRPSAAEQAACRPWLERELELVAPSVVIALGATAAHALIGRATPIGRNRGQPLTGALFSPVLVTAHPSSVLRERDRDTRHDALAAIVSDLRVAVSLAAEDAPSSRGHA
ncbi:MAG TPA: UdgX family uracil-DNA binding protein [Solirubrobacteraceae bacterium]|jgi:DNA polymerase|nr:UdgX family uracil-DNA binding protein [Solirubrobacteraceae bacterium]